MLRNSRENAKVYYYYPFYCLLFVTGSFIALSNTIIMTSRLSSRAVYNGSQISKYFSHISLPKDSQDLQHTSSKLHEPNNALKFLASLQRHQLAAVPFENLTLHYSSHHSISLDPDYLYNKIVCKGRGGYCMENNCFFGTILRTLGFTICSAGARVSQSVSATGDVDDFGGW